MRCAAPPLPAQPIPILPSSHHNRLPSPKPFFCSSFPTAARIISLSANCRGHLRRLTPSSSAAAVEALDTSSNEEEEEQRLRVVVTAPENPRLTLRFMWMEKNIGVAVDHVIPGSGTIPLSPYYFWPRKDAWEELKAKIEEKPWISQKRMIFLLNQATDIINLWQQSSGNLY